MKQEDFEAMWRIPDGIRRGYADCRFGQIHYAVHEPKNATEVVLVCCHASPVTWRSWRALMPSIGQDRLVIAFDSPGHGDSSKPASQPSIPDYAAAIGDALDVLGLGPARLPTVRSKGFPTSLASAIVGGVDPEQFAKLSPRETECLEWTAQGKTTWEVAQILRLSDSTVTCNYYIRNAMKKLAVHTKAHAVSKAAVLGMFIRERFDPKSGRVGRSTVYNTWRRRKARAWCKARGDEPGPYADSLIVGNHDTATEDRENGLLSEPVYPDFEEVKTPPKPGSVVAKLIAIACSSFGLATLVTVVHGAASAGAAGF